MHKRGLKCQPQLKLVFLFLLSKGLKGHYGAMLCNENQLQHNWKGHMAQLCHSVLCYLVTVLTGSKVAPVRKEPTETFCGEKTTEHLNKNAHVILYIHSVEI